MCGCVVVRASDLQPRGPLHVTTLGKLFTHNVPLFTKRYQLVPAISWEDNRRSGIALAMRHSGISIYGLNVLGKGMSLSSIHILWHLYLYL